MIPKVTKDNYTNILQKFIRDTIKPILVHGKVTEIVDSNTLEIEPDGAKPFLIGYNSIQPKVGEDVIAIAYEEGTDFHLLDQSSLQSDIVNIVCKTLVHIETETVNIEAEKVKIEGKYKVGELRSILEDIVSLLQSITTTTIPTQPNPSYQLGLANSTLLDSVAKIKKDIEDQMLV